MNTNRKGIASILLVLAPVVLILILSVFIVWRHNHRSNNASGFSNQSETTNTSISNNQPAQSSSLAAGSNAYTIMSGGISRTYRVYVPEGLTGSVPLVIMLHGGGGSGKVAEQYYGWDKQADSAKFIVAYPDGLGPSVPAWNVDGNNLNGKSCCGYSVREGISDIQFIKDLVSKIESQATIDKQRIFATGISNGGIMSYSLACETNLFAAIGPDSATMLNSCDSPNTTSVIHIHGLQDTTIRFDGGLGAGSAGIDGPSVPDVISDWRKIDNCGLPNSTTSGVVTTSISDCPNGLAVELITIANGGHGWPGSPAKAANTTSGGTLPSQAIDATSVIWQFFSSHPKAS